MLREHGKSSRGSTAKLGEIDMKTQCYDIGTIQAFLDGETASHASANIAVHIADCVDCATTLAVAEEETSFVFSTLDREMNSLVPTQRLWSRINDSIEVEKSRVPFHQRLFGFLSASLLSPSFSAAAGVLLVTLMFAAMWTFRPISIDSGDVAKINVHQPAVEAVQIGVPTVSTETPAIDSEAVEPAIRENTRTSTTQPTYATYNESPRPVRQAQPARAMTLAYIPGEESYLSTISELKRNYDSQKDTVLTPSGRVAIERDMAVVEHAIKEMQKIVRKNPNNQAARQVLYASYQDKIDLLSSVSQREEMLASLR